MLHVVLLDGPYAGRVRSSDDLAAAGVSIDDILANLVRHGWSWCVLWPPRSSDPGQQSLQHQASRLQADHGLDLSGQVLEATPVDEAEVHAWAYADVTCRIYRAALARRGIRFRGHRWVLPDVQAQPDEFAARLGELEEVLAASEVQVGIQDDDGVYDLLLATRS